MTQDEFNEMAWRDFMLFCTITAKDHYYDIGKPMAYQAALEMAMEVAKLRRSERIIVEP